MSSVTSRVFQHPASALDHAAPQWNSHSWDVILEYSDSLLPARTSFDKYVAMTETIIDDADSLRADMVAWESDNNSKLPVELLPIERRATAAV